MSFITDIGTDNGIDLDVDVKAKRMLARGRAYVAFNAPYIATTLMSLVPRAVRGIETMGITARLVLYYDPYWMVSDPELNDPTTTDMVVGTCLYHECWHPLRGMWRLEALPDGELANIAGDIPINEDILKNPDVWKLPSWVVTIENMGKEGVVLPEGKTLEQYYKLLEKNRKKLQSLLDKLGAKGGAKPGSGRCGGGAGSTNFKELELQLDKAGGRDELEQQVAREATLHAIKEHIAHYGRGSVPGYDVEDVPFKKEAPPINWEKTLQHVAKRTSGQATAGGDDFSLSRPSRRSALLGVVRPGLIDHQCVPGFVRDTSGSMGKDQINHANNVIISVMVSLGVDYVWLIDADTKVQGKPRLVRVKDILHIPAIGRGGTNFVAALNYVEKLRPKPDVLFYLTDGDGTAPAKGPSMPVIWCIVPTAHGVRPAKWGHLVVCDKSQKLWDQYA